MFLMTLNIFRSSANSKNVKHLIKLLIKILKSQVDTRIILIVIVLNETCEIKWTVVNK